MHPCLIIVYSLISKYMITFITIISLLKKIVVYVQLAAEELVEDLLGRFYSGLFSLIHVTGQRQQFIVVQVKSE